MNQQRAAAGLGALSTTVICARRRGATRRMVRQQFFAHVSPSGSTLGERARAAAGRAARWARRSAGAPAARDTSAIVTAG